MLCRMAVRRTRAAISHDQLPRFSLDKYNCSTIDNRCLTVYIRVYIWHVDSTADTQPKTHGIDLGDVPGLFVFPNKEHARWTLF